MVENYSEMNSLIFNEQILFFTKKKNLGDVCLCGIFSASERYHTSAWSCTLRTCELHYASQRLAQDFGLLLASILWTSAGIYPKRTLLCITKTESQHALPSHAHTCKLLRYFWDKLMGPLGEKERQLSSYGTSRDTYIIFCLQFQIVLAQC